MEWISTRLGAQWEERLIVTLDKVRSFLVSHERYSTGGQTILRGDYLIDAQPYPEKEIVRAMDGRSEQCMRIFYLLWIQRSNLASISGICRSLSSLVDTHCVPAAVQRIDYI